MSYRNKTYVALDYDEDAQKYNLMLAWTKNENIEFDFHNAHELNNLQTWSSEETIKSKLRERIANSKNFILLVGKQTRYKYRYVKWEIEQAIKNELPIIVVNLNGLREYDSEYCPPILNNELAIHTIFRPGIIRYSLDHWPELYRQHRIKGESGAYFWQDHVYKNLGL